MQSTNMGAPASTPSLKDIAVSLDPGWKWSTDPDVAAAQFKAVLAAKELRRPQEKKAKLSPAVKTRRAPRETITLSGYRGGRGQPGGTWQPRFFTLLPARPFCADVFNADARMRPRDEAIGFRHIQFNSSARKNWLLFDLDYKNAAGVIEEANVALPTLLIENPASGHAKAAYLLDAGVTYYDKSGAFPIEFARDVERGYVRRLGADRSYSGHLANNPLSPAWRVHHLRDGGYSLGELNNWLEPKDKRLWLPSERETGLGRNVSLFNELRRIAYQEVRDFKAKLEDYGAYCKRLLAVALELNSTMNFTAALVFSEVRQIVKSVAKWTWRRFSVEGFKAAQSQRGKKGMASRWAGHVSLAKQKPWAALGISRATYYRRKAEEAAQS